MDSFYQRDYCSTVSVTVEDSQCMNSEKMSITTIYETHTHNELLLIGNK